jgi:hypothetical protein
LPLITPEECKTRIVYFDEDQPVWMRVRLKVPPPSTKTRSRNKRTKVVPIAPTGERARGNQFFSHHSGW